MSRKSGDTEPAQAGYDEALLSANWNPVVELLDAPASDKRRTRRRGRSVISDEEANAFLGRIYAAGE